MKSGSRRSGSGRADRTGQVRDRSSEPKDDLRHLRAQSTPVWFSSSETEEELEARCVRDHEESYARYQHGIADGTYTTADLQEVGTVASKRLFRARTILTLSSANAVETRWARAVVADHVAQLVEERLVLAGVNRHDRGALSKEWALAVLANKMVADPEQVIWAEQALAEEKWF